VPKLPMTPKILLNLGPSAGRD